MEEQESEAEIALNKLKWYYKYSFKEWNILANNTNSNRSIFMGTLGENDDPDVNALIKRIKIKNNNYVKLLKEVYFLACCKRNRYFVGLIDVFTLKDNLYIIFKGEGTDLSYLITYTKFDYNLTISNSSRYIIFQILCGLKYLHDNNLSHNDIKPSNIIVEADLKIKICDMGSTDINSTKKYGGTNGYSSPNCLLGKKRTKEDDIWSVGVVFLELLKKQLGIFSLSNDQNKKLNIIDDGPIILQYILKRFYDIRIGNGNWNENINYNIIINNIKNDNYDAFEYELNLNLDLFKDINDEDKTFIKNLLEINPAKRKTVQDLLKETIFENFWLENSEFDFKLEDYKDYLSEGQINEETFKNHLQSIKEKFLGKEIFIKNKNKNN